MTSLLLKSTSLCHVAQFYTHYNHKTIIQQIAIKSALKYRTERQQAWTAWPSEESAERWFCGTARRRSHFFSIYSNLFMPFAVKRAAVFPVTLRMKC